MITVSRCSMHAVKALTVAIASVIAVAALADPSGGGATAPSSKQIAQAVQAAQVDPALQQAFAGSMSSVVTSKVSAADAIRAQMAGPIMNWFAPKPVKNAVNALGSPPGSSPGAVAATAKFQPQDSGNSSPSGSMAQPSPTPATADPAANAAPATPSTGSPPVATPAAATAVAPAAANPAPAPAGTPAAAAGAAPAPADPAPTPSVAAAIPAANPAGAPATLHSDYVQSSAEPSPSPVYAGLAYEVHWLRPDGARVPVDPRAHHFHSGDRFSVPFRPTLPGIVDVYNVDPNGVTTKIDSQRMAAGQLLVLGTYRFVKESGPETLRLVLTPCGTPELLAATRSIVRTEEFSRSDPPAAAPLQSCAAASARPAHKTRAIERIAAEGETAYAMDAVSSDESRTGRLDAREITIRFQHE